MAHFVFQDISNLLFVPLYFFSVQKFSQIISVKACTSSFKILPESSFRLTPHGSVQPKYFKNLICTWMGKKAWKKYVLFCRYFSMNDALLCFCPFIWITFCSCLNLKFLVGLKLRDSQFSVHYISWIISNMDAQCRSKVASHLLCFLSGTYIVLCSQPGILVTSLDSKFLKWYRVYTHLPFANIKMKENRVGKRTSEYLSLHVFSSTMFVRVLSYFLKSGVSFNNF